MDMNRATVFQEAEEVLMRADIKLLSVADAMEVMNYFNAKPRTLTIEKKN